VTTEVLLDTNTYLRLAKLKTAKVVDNELIPEIYDALERNGDMTETWRQAKHREFGRIFGT
jgi:hypothetical protein